MSRLPSLRRVVCLPPSRLVCFPTPVPRWEKPAEGEPKPAEGCHCRARGSPLGCHSRESGNPESKTPSCPDSPGAGITLDSRLRRNETLCILHSAKRLRLMFPKPATLAADYHPASPSPSSRSAPSRPTSCQSWFRRVGSSTESIGPSWPVHGEPLAYALKSILSVWVFAS